MVQFIPELKIGIGPWCVMGKPCATKEQAESFAAMFAKWWLGAAESRATETSEESSRANSESESSLVQTFAVDEAKRRKSRKKSPSLNADANV